VPHIVARHVPPTIDRAYSILHVKAVDADLRQITGMATTPDTDRMGDVVEPLGATFKNPLPLLLNHDKARPVGQVTFGKATKDGIPFTATFPDPDQIQSATLRERVLEAWDSVKLKLIRGTSIGFKALDNGVQLLKTGGLRFTHYEIFEMSLVVIPANAAASIHTIKAFDAPFLAASGDGTVPTSAGVPALRAVKAHGHTMKTTAEQITSFENTRAAKVGRMSEIMNKSAEDGTTLDAEQTTEYEGLAEEVKSLDAHLARLAAHEKMSAESARPVNGTEPAKATESRGGIVSVKSNLPPGTGFTRYAMALAAGRGSRLEAAEYAKRWEKDTPEVGMILKAAVTAGTTTDSDWAAPLVVYQNLASEFVELLRPATIIGRLAGVRRVPFNITMPNQTQGATVGWVGQGLPKQVSELKFDQISLGMAKAAGIVILSEELVRSSSPSAEAIVRQDLIATMAAFLDVQFVDPAVAAVSNVSPASITNGITPIDATGTTAATFRTDFKAMVAAMVAAGINSLAGGHWIMTETQALAFGLMQNALGQPEFSGMSMTGGTLLGFPVIASEAVPAEGGSPAGSRIIFVLPKEIFVADDGGVAIDVSREASVQLNSAPDNPVTASTVMVSLWQNNLVGLRAERFINWKRRRNGSVGIIEGAIYTG